MRARILTCKNHTNLRWSCKSIAWSGFYNGSRNIFFSGITTGEMYSDGSGVKCTRQNPDGTFVDECPCAAADLILAPEDALVTTPDD